MGWIMSWIYEGAMNKGIGLHVSAGTGEFCVVKHVNEYYYSVNM